MGNLYQKMIGLGAAYAGVLTGTGTSPIKREQMFEISVIALAVLVGIMITILIVLIVQIGELKKKYRDFMSGSDGKNLESTVLNRFKEIDELKSESKYMSEKLNIACDTLLSTYQKVGIVKYDAFKEMGGKLSFSLCMLDDQDNGFILSSMHTREGCYSYIKEIIKGESFVILASEERKALDEAKNKKNFMAE